jgi:L-arabinokinase
MAHDTDTFLALVHDEQERFFASQRPIMIARAPGQLDLIGGSADYGGSQVLSLPLANAVFVAIQPDPEPIIRIREQRLNTHSTTEELTVPLDILAPDASPIEYEQFRTAMASSCAPDHSPAPWVWSAAGAWLALMREEFIQFRGGARVLIRSDLPLDFGIGAGAALLVATMQALTAAYGISLPPREMALHCQVVTQRMLGIPCEATRYLTAMCGIADHLLQLRAHPCTVLDNLPLPHNLALWGIAPSPSDGTDPSLHADLRIGAAMGYRIMAAAGEEAAQSPDGRWRGYLANINPSEFEFFYRGVLPEQIDGAVFLDQYGDIPDVLGTIDPARRYAVASPTMYAIYENFRARSAAMLLRAANGMSNDSELAFMLGELLYQSHASYRACAQVTPGVDRLVAMVQAAGPRQGLYGTRSAGSGNSGVVAVLGRADAAETVHTIANRYTEETGQPAQVLGASSQGSAAFDTRQLK